MDLQDLNRTRRWNSNVSLIPALIVIGIGVLFLLGNLHIVYLHDWWEYWPVVVIAVGLVKLVDSDFNGGRVSGAIIIFVGGLFLADNLGYLKVNVWDLWPLFLIGAGILMLVNRTTLGSVIFPPGSGESSPGGVVNSVAIFGGSNRKWNGGGFRGGQMVAVFGGVDLNLRSAEMDGDSASLEIAAIFGGADIKVPGNWAVIFQGAPIFGGVSDRTVQPTPGPGVKKLYIKGVVIFGGIDIKN